MLSPLFGGLPATGAVARTATNIRSGAKTPVAGMIHAVTLLVILAALLYIHRVTSTRTVSRVTEDYVEQGLAHSLEMHPIPPGCAVFRIHGPFLFGSTDKLEAVEERLHELPPVVTLRLRNMTAIDATGLHALETLAAALHRSGRTLLLCGMRDQPAVMMRRADFQAHNGDANILPSLKAAIARASALLRRGELA